MSDVRYSYGQVILSRQLLEESFDVVGFVATHVAALERERELDRQFGANTRTRPDRNDMWRIQRAQQLREWNRRNIAALGRPAGEFRRG